MKFGIFYELQLPRPWKEGDEHRLYQNALDQIELADQLGYDYAWQVEHHFLEEYSHSPVAGIVPRRGQPAHQADPARPRHHAAHHQPSGPRRREGRQPRPAVERPLRVRHGRERLDHRARAVRRRHGQQARDLRGGRAAPSCRCSRTAPSEHHGKYFNMPLRNVLPKPLQKPHPPLWVACSQLDTLAKCGEWGMGALGFQFVSADAAHAWVHAYYNAFVKRQKKLADYRTNPNIALVSFFMCAKTDEEARARADGDTFFQFSLRFYGAARRPPAPAGRHGQHVGRVPEVEGGQSRGARRGAARRPDRLAGDDPAQAAQVPVVQHRPGRAAQPGRHATRTSTSANRSSCSPRK